MTDFVERGIIKKGMKVRDCYDIFDTGMLLCGAGERSKPAIEGIIVLPQPPGRGNVLFLMEFAPDAPNSEEQWDDYLNFKLREFRFEGPQARE